MRKYVSIIQHNTGHCQKVPFASGIKSSKMKGYLMKHNESLADCS